jgi:DNA-binding transcriptional ArsR family regulator
MWPAPPCTTPGPSWASTSGSRSVEKTKRKILKVLSAIPHGVLYSTTDWHRLLSEEKREIRHALDELKAEGKIEIQKSGRSDKPLYKLREEVGE